jgi:hypothetical protein
VGLDDMMHPAEDHAESQWSMRTVIFRQRFADEQASLTPIHGMTGCCPRLRNAIMRNWLLYPSRSNAERSRIVDLSRGESFGFRPSDASAVDGVLACAVHAKARATNGTAPEAQKRVASLSIPTRGSGHLFEQSGATRLGEILRDWARQGVFDCMQDWVEKKVWRQLRKLENEGRRLEAVG